MKSKPDKTRHELIAALQALRLLVKEVGGNYLASLQADVARVERAVDARADDAPGPAQVAELRRMLKWINALEVKPQKGRRRDLRELDRIITRLSETVENW